MKRDFDIHQWQAKYLREFTEPSQNLVLMVNNYIDAAAISDEEKLEELLELVSYCEEKMEELNSPL